jgi:hypothetical protein
VPLAGSIALRRALGACALLGTLGLWSGVARASETDERFARAATALNANQPNAALVELEALADRGVLHPDVAFSRGLAYAMRARSDAAQSGDLGRAAAGFEEALRLRPEDADAARALDLIHAEVARRRARQDKNDTIVRPSLDRVLLSSLSPLAWTILAAIASLLFSIGLLIRRGGSRVLRVSGTVLVPLGVLALIVLTPAAVVARSRSEHLKEGVIVVAEVSMRDEDGQPAQTPDIPEATLVEVGQREGDAVAVRWGSYEGFVPAESVRVVPRLETNE